jgi:hypothetical protein
MQPQHHKLTLPQILPQSTPQLHNRYSQRKLQLHQNFKLMKQTFHTSTHKAQQLPLIRHRHRLYNNQVRRLPSFGEQSLLQKIELMTKGKKKIKPPQSQPLCRTPLQSDARNTMGTRGTPE